MIKIIRNISLLALAIALATDASSMRYMGSGNSNGNGGGNGTNSNTDPRLTQEEEYTRAAACAPANALTNLELNNVRARIETGGSMWQDRAVSRAFYEVPKDGGVSSIYSGALWMGGLSPDAQLKLAAVTFRADGNDYWPGPLTNDGTATVTEDICTQFDRFFMSFRQDAQAHRAYWDCTTSGGDDCADYSMPAYFAEYPAEGDPNLQQDFYLAPFYDYNDDGFYNPQEGDYPWYDFLKEIDCRTRNRESVVPLFGDQTYYWIFNDRGNIHTESQGQPIGMEIRAQAFAFTTNDEINNMTFYNYVLINQGSQTLTETYFGSWVDADLGFAADDYVGCDVQRGLGYCYNGDNTDEAGSGSNGYGANPPAVGVDFFEGPYQDYDEVDNPLTDDVALAISQKGIPYKGLGIGYGDGVVDNERFGMRRFVYYNIGSNPINGDPDVAPDYYNYMRGFWKNGDRMQYGGNGIPGESGVTEIAAGYMFPKDTDPLHWGTEGVEMPFWSEEVTLAAQDNQPGDRRFIQSAGPFTLLPGDYNNITVGVVWARSGGGGALASVALMKDADDKAQALFDNCFELVSGPDAPDVTVRELENEIILMLSNENPISNNFQENYLEFDASIPEEIESLGLTYTPEQRSYTFEGYMVYQLANATVGPDELNDVSKARLIFQTDVENDITSIVNYEFDSDNDLIIPTLKVNGANEGITRSFRITQDAFAQGVNTLVNHKTYYFMAIAYGYNNYLDYNTETRQGQSRVFISSRKAAIGEIQVIPAIPHTPSPAAEGTIQNSVYGQGIALTRLEGRGAGTRDLLFDPASENEIIQNGFSAAVTYAPGAGPVDVRVIDPLKVQSADFELRLAGPEDVEEDNPDSLRWELVNLETGEVVPHYKSFRVASEDVLIDYGISINWGNYIIPNPIEEEPNYLVPEFLSGTITYANPAQRWLGGIPDQEGQDPLNWIRSGSDLEVTDNGTVAENIYADYGIDITTTFAQASVDGQGIYEGVLGGTWAPYSLVSYSQLDNGNYLNNFAPTYGLLSMATFNGTTPEVAPMTNTSQTSFLELIGRITNLPSVDIVLTSDKSKWTRCAVLEMQSNPFLAQGFFGENYSKNRMRKAPSVDKNGRKVGDEGYNDAEGTLGGAQPTGMGWFPGYAIDMTTGERLNMAFGEDSWLNGENGRDMIWNPTENLFNSNGTQIVGGGQHWIYVFRNVENEDFGGSFARMPRYDSCQYVYSVLNTTPWPNPTSPASTQFNNWRRIFAATAWVGSALLTGEAPLLSVEQGLIPTETRISLRVGTAYTRYNPNTPELDDPEDNGAQNGWRNLYRFSTRGLAPIFNDESTLTTALDIINIVPNPYYAFSQYETSKLDNRVKITNLPEVCTVSIYDMNGTLIRQFRKGDPLTSLDWDLKNANNIPIAGGTYIIHVDVPGIGEKILKWFGVLRPVDLDRF